MITFKKGESLIEVLLAMSIFSLASVSTVAAINFSLFTAQSDLEITQARTELDTQAEALRFIQSNYTASKTRNDADTGEVYKNIYTDIWRAIKTPALLNSKTANPSIYTGDQFVAPTYTVCSDAYDPSSAQRFIAGYHAFAINPRILSIDSGSTPGSARVDAVITSYDPDDSTYFNSTFQRSSTYPRFVYSNGAVITEEEELGGSSASVSDYRAYHTAAHIEGLWAYGIPSAALMGSEPEYIDYYINTCWYPQGLSHAQTISTTIRLYNPDAIEVSVTEKPAFYINYYHRTLAGDWTLTQVLTRANLDSSGNYSLDIKDEPQANVHDGYMFSGWMTADDAEVAWISDPSADKEFYYTKFRHDKMSTGDYKGLFCQNKSLSSSGFHPECIYEQMTTDATLASSNPNYGLVKTISGGTHNADHVDLIMVEKPPMDISVILDGSGSMPQEIAGAKNGLNNLADYVLGQTVGKMSLTFLRQEPGRSDGSNYYELCSLGYRTLAGTCGEGTSTPFTFNNRVNGISSTTTDNNNRWILASGSSSPEYLSYNAIMEKTLALANSSDPAYNKMIILITDTVPTSTSLDRFRSAYPSYCAAHNNCANYEDIQKAIVDVAHPKRIRIYVIESYKAGTVIGGIDVGSDGDDTTEANVNTAWRHMTSNTGGAIIDAPAALGKYHHNSNKWNCYFEGSNFTYNYNSGKLQISLDGGTTYTTYGN